MRERAPHVLACLAGVVAVAVLVGGLLWWRSAADDPALRACPVDTSVADAVGPELLPVADLLPAGSVGDERRPLVRAADRIVRALGHGAVVGGRFHDSALDVPALVPLDAVAPGHVLLAAAGSDGGQVLTSVQVPGGDVAWSRAFGGSMRGGGLVGEHLVVLSGGDRPGVLTLDPEDGAVRRCLGLEHEGQAGELRVLTDQAGPEIVLATSSGAGATVHKVDPAVGDLAWSRPLDALRAVDTLTVVPDEEGAVVVAGRTPPDPVRLAELADGGAAGAPSLEALAVSDGRPLWTWPAAGPADEVAAGVGATGDGTLVVLTAAPDRAAPREAPPRTAVVALDPAGEEQWRTELGRDPVGVEIWGDTVVLRGTSPAGRLELRALAAATGQDLWRLTTPADGDGGLGPGTALGDRYVVPVPAGLLEVDPATGRHRLVRTDLPVDQVLGVGDLVLLRSGPALLVAGPV